MKKINESVGLATPFSSQTEVDAYDAYMIGLPCDSPGSVDSGMVESPISTCDISTPGSPSSPFSPEQEVHTNYVVNKNNVGSVNAGTTALQFEPNVLQTLQSSSDSDSLSLKTQTKGVDERTIKKFLELLVMSKSTDEPGLISNLLTTMLTNSMKKDSLLHNAQQAPVQVCQSRKRAANGFIGEIPHKGPRMDLPVNDKQVEPSIVILEQPEKNYRARYESERCRGPVHGSSEMTFPTIKVVGYTGSLWVTVYLVTMKGAPHFHLLCGPGSTKLPCRNVMLPGGITAIQILIGPETDMTAILDCLSLKRKRNFEADKELKRRGLNPVDWKSERKEACLCFTAEIPGVPPQTVTCKSRVFQCTAPPGNPEIWWMKPVEGSATGGEEIGLIGKKFPKGFKVRFFGDLPSGEKWEAFGEVDRAKSNPGAGVVKCPSLQEPITSPLTVNVEICGGEGSTYVSSDSAEFTYVPVEKPSSPEDTIPFELDIFQGNLGITDLIHEMSQYLPEVRALADISRNDKTDKECEHILSAITELHKNGHITANQLQELKSLVSLQDILLLEAFRSSRQSVSECEFLLVFCQYLAGLNIPQ